MALVLTGLSKESHDEAAVVFASLLLQDAEIEITAENIATLIEESGNEVESYWPAIFAGLLKKVNIVDLIANSTRVGGGGSSGAGASAGASKGAAAKEEEKKEEKKEEAAEVVTGSGNLFGDSGGAY